MLATADMEPKPGGLLWRHGKCLESKPQSFQGVRDYVKRELREQAMQLGFEGLEGNGTFTLAELLHSRKVVR